MPQHDLKQSIIAHIERGSTKEQIISDCIFAGFSYKDIIQTFSELDREGKIPAYFLTGKYPRSSYVQHVSRVSDRITSEDHAPTPAFFSFISSHRVLVIVSLVVIIIGIGGGVAWWRSITHSPQQVVRRALFSLLNTSSYEYVGHASGVVAHTEEKTKLLWDNVLFSSGPISLSAYGVVQTIPDYSHSVLFSFFNGELLSTSTLLWEGTFIKPYASSGLFIKLSDRFLLPTSSDFTIAQKSLGRWVALSTSTHDTGFLAPVSSRRFFDGVMGEASYNSFASLKTAPLEVVYEGDARENNTSFSRYGVTLSPAWEDAFFDYCQNVARTPLCDSIKTILDQSRMSIWIVPSTQIVYRMVLIPIAGSLVLGDWSVASISLTMGNINHTKIIQAPSPSFSIEQIKSFARDTLNQ
ncbi:MAG: hypothetical protein KBC26_02780 [Candidatus Pacebacteria bacterium]|nr:hypothetical protein [Candidatus Paceibacterota bacterium]